MGTMVTKWLEWGTVDEYDANDDGDDDDEEDNGQDDEAVNDIRTITQLLQLSSHKFKISANSTNNNYEDAPRDVSVKRFATWWSVGPMTDTRNPLQTKSSSWSCITGCDT